MPHILCHTFYVTHQNSLKNHPPTNTYDQHNPLPKTKTPQTSKRDTKTPRGEGAPRKNPKTSHFLETIDNLLASLHKSKQKHRPIYTKNKANPRKTKNKKWYRFNPQHIRRDIARSLGELYDDALRSSRAPELDTNERLNYGRLAAYTAQTINSITKTYDEVRIEETLEELKKFVKKHITP